MVLDLESCFPRDNRAFASYAKVGIDHNIGSVTDAFNEDHALLFKGILHS